MPSGGLKRAPLTDVSNLQMQQLDGAGDVKRTKLDHPDTAPGEVAAEAPASIDAVAAAESAQS